MGVWGGAPAGSRGRAPHQGVRGAKPTEAESFEAFAHLKNAKNLLSVCQAYNEVWGRSTQRGPGAEPCSEISGEAPPLKLKALKHLHNEDPKICCQYAGLSKPIAIAVSTQMQPSH